MRFVAVMGFAIHQAGVEGFQVACLLEPYECGVFHRLIRSLFLYGPQEFEVPSQM